MKTVDVTESTYERHNIDHAMGSREETGRRNWLEEGGINFAVRVSREHRSCVFVNSTRRKFNKRTRNFPTHIVDTGTHIYFTIKEQTFFCSTRSLYISHSPSRRTAREQQEEEEENLQLIARSFSLSLWEGKLNWLENCFSNSNI
jgi:hypothetical protein